MKINVVLDDKDAIDGFVCVNIKPGTESLQSVINNSCTTIIASDVLDKLSYTETKKVINLMIEKLRIGGELIIKGVGLLQFCRLVCSGSVSAEDAGAILQANSSFQDTRDLTKIFESANLIIDSLKFNGISYEIIATRNTGAV